MVEIPARWPSRVCRCLPVAVSHILIEASAAGPKCGQLLSKTSHAKDVYSQQLAMDRPSGENRTAATPLLWPLNTSFCLYFTYDGFFLGGVAILGVTKGLLMDGASRDCLWLRFQPSR